MAPPMELLTPFNYHQWKEYMDMKLHSKIIFRLKMEIEAEPFHYVDKEKYWNRLDEAYGCVRLSISIYLLLHINALNTSKEGWDQIYSLFYKKDDLRIY